MSRTRRDHSWAVRWFAGIKDEAKGRDTKPGSKPPGWFKRMRRRIRKAKAKQAFINDKQIPIEKKNDVWDWN